MNVALLLPYDAGRQARADGLVRVAPAYANPDNSRAWIRGYDAEQARIDAVSARIRAYVPQRDPWDFA